MKRILLAYVVFLLMASTATATFDVFNSGSFDTTVYVTEAASPASTMVSNTSGSFDTTVYVEYYIFGDWSDWWIMEYAGDLSISNLLASTFSTTVINLTWTKSTNTTHTLIRRGNSTYPTTTNDGVNVSFSTNTSYNDTGLNVGTLYYYSAWAYDNASSTYSDSYSTSANYTKPGNCLDFAVTDTTMTTISLDWTNGTNATRGVIVRNATGYAAYPSTPTNGTVVYNDTETSTTITGLTENVTYYFSLWGYIPDDEYVTCGQFSPGYVSVNDSTTAAAGSPTGFTVERVNHNSIYLNWTKHPSAETTHIRRKAGSLPTSVTDGVQAYNGTGASYNDTGINPATHYYYRAFTWNGENMSTGSATGHNRTTPAPPTNLIGTVSGTTLTINWTKGTGATRTLLKNNTAAYPTLSTGDVVANTTNNTWIRNGITDIDYHRAWSWATVDGVELFSHGVNLLYGGLEINVYREDMINISIVNYTVFIKNQDGSETYQNISCNNPFRISVENVPNGEDIIIRVSKDGYKSRTKTMDLFENYLYQVNFYLPPDEAGGGDEGDDDYIPPDDTDNITYAEQYLLTVVGPKDTYGADPPIEDAYVVIEVYNNVTDEYDEAFSDYTDANGQVTVDLIPGRVYQVTITHEYYETEIVPNFTPREVLYADDWKYTFRMIPIGTTPGEDVYDLFLTNITFTADMIDAGYLQLGNITIVYYDINSSTIDIMINLYEMYNGSTTYMNTTSATNDNDVTVTFGDINTTRHYKVVLWFNNTADFTDVISPFVLPVNPIYYIGEHEFNLDTRIKNVFGPFMLMEIDVGWHTLLSVLIAIGLMMFLGPYNTGIGIIAAGLGLFFTDFIFSFWLSDSFPVLSAISVFIIIIGVIYMLTKYKGVDNL